MFAGWVEIVLDNIAHNLKEIKRIAGNKKVMAVVKADAYGHGLVPVAQVLEKQGIEFLAVSYVHEGIELRKAGIKLPIVILLGVMPFESEALFEYQLIPVAYRLEFLRQLSTLAVAKKRQVEVFIKVDTGMGRLGIFYQEALSFLKEVRRLKGIKVAGLTSHLALAETDKSFTQRQFRRFQEVIKAARAEGFELKDNHIANSAGALMYAQQFDIIRPGISLYGIYPSYELRGQLDLRPAMRFKTQVLYIKHLPAGVGVSYGHTFVTQRPTRVAILPIGYDQGLFRQLSGKASVLVRGRRVPIVGAICMHLTMVDVTDLPQVAIGDEAVILGKQGQEGITAEELASQAGTIAYDVLCRLGRSNPRLYL